jgi:hypothetical protein
VSGKTAAAKKARALQSALNADPALCNVGYMRALTWVQRAGDQPWQNWQAFVERCRAKAHKVPAACKVQQ